MGYVKQVQEAQVLDLSIPVGVVTGIAFPLNCMR